jgi:triosephosphate isomerase (TIM)
MVRFPAAIGRRLSGIKRGRPRVKTENAVRKLVAGNWKMNGSLASLDELDAIAQAAKGAAVDVAVCPPATLIAAAVARQPGLAIGAQDCHWNASGAHTGCLSVGMLAEAGAHMVIVGHSERRADNHETDAEVKLKAEAAISGGLTAIVCVGETEAERDAGEAIGIVTRQLEGSSPSNATADSLVIAYEPVWAIGTGRTPTVSDVAEMHAAIRRWLEAAMGPRGSTVRILYGGSVKPSNALQLLHVANVDGALVGGASLKGADFVPIISAAG